jgi:4-hydroxy-tetrahydrodipicolinate synthase
MLTGIIPIVLIPFDADGDIDEASLRRVIRFELDGGCDALGVNGFASEAYKMSDAERLRCARIAADEVGGVVPLVIGVSPGSINTARQLADQYADLNPSALMTLSPAVMQNDQSALVDFYVDLGNYASVPIMVQQSPHYPGYSGTKLSVVSLAAIAQGSSNVKYFKIEGPGSAERIGALKKRVDAENVALFGGVGGIALQEELRAGARGLLPGVGFNEYFIRVWAAWTRGDEAQADSILREVQPLVEAVSGKGHEYSLHVRKYLMQRASVIQTTTVRQPTAPVDLDDLHKIGALADSLDLRISQ